MSGSTFLLVALVGGVGACARFWVDRGTQRILSLWSEPAGAKLGILIIDVIGCFLAGAAIQLMPTGLIPIISTRFLGGFTTFPTAPVDAVALQADGFRGRNLALALGTWAASWGIALTGITCAGQSFVAQLRPLYGLVGEGLAAMRSFVAAFRALMTLILIY